MSWKVALKHNSTRQERPIMSTKRSIICTNLIQYKSHCSCMLVSVSNAEQRNSVVGFAFFMKPFYEMTKQMNSRTKALQFKCIGSHRFHPIGDAEYLACVFPLVAQLWWGCMLKLQLVVLESLAVGRKLSEQLTVQTHNMRARNCLRKRRDQRNPQGWKTNDRFANVGHHVYPQTWECVVE